METLIQDIRYGIRSLLKQPGFALIAVIMLALGIGANTAIFSVVNGVLLHPLPFTESGRLVMVWNRGVQEAGGDRTPLCVADLLDWRAQNRSFESISAFQNAAFNYVGKDTAEQVRGVNVTSNFLSTLGIRLQLGRDFQESDEKVGAARTVLLSDRFWRTHFAADRDVIGRAVDLSGVNTTIVGVMPANVDFPSQDVDLWRAIQWDQPTRRGPYFLRGVARLKPGVSIQQAAADARMMATSFDPPGKHFDFNILSVNDFIVGDVRSALIVLLVAVLLVLLIATVNVANLTLVRAASRVKEISIRTALGASRGRIVRRLLTESLLLAIAGGLVGTLCATWGVSVLVRFAPENLPRLAQIHIDGFVLGWTALLSILTGVIFGLAPAWQSSRLNLNEAIREGGRTTESAGRRRWRNLLIVGELALAVMLVTGAGLLVKSLFRLQQVQTGIEPGQVLTAQLALPPQRYTDASRLGNFESRAIEQIKSLPGVRTVALSSSLPPEDSNFSSNFTIEGQSANAIETRVAEFISVTPDYFRALNIPLRTGREFNDADSPDAPNVVIINETFRRRFFPDRDPVDKRLNFGSEQKPDWERIVGVVGDVKYNGLAEEVQPAIYFPIAQSPSRGVALVIKANVADPLTLTSVVRNSIRNLDAELPVTQVHTMEQLLSAATAQPRFRTSLTALLAVVALMLACVGIYGVISYSVTQRTHEIGIRMALGAQKGNVLKLVIGQALILAITGVVVGLIASFGLTRLMSGLLFGVQPTDVPTFVMTALLLTGTALIASYLPARRATKVDPLVALRYE